MKSGKIKKIAVLLILLAAGAAGGWFWLQTSSTGLLPAKVEQMVVPHYSQVSGVVTQVNIQQGQQVQAGDVLMVLDHTDQQYAVEQLEQVLVQKQAALDQLLSGADAEAVQQARNGVKAAQAARDTAQLQYDTASRELQRATPLYEAGGLPQQDYEKLEQAVLSAENGLKTAEIQIDTAQQQVVILSKTADANAVRAAQAAVSQTESQLAQAKEQLQDYTITAACDGTVISVNYTNGAVVNPNSDVAELVDQTQSYLLAYLPVEQMASINYGDAVTVLAEEQEYTGHVCYLDVKAQYTPQEFQTAIQKNQEQVKMKVTLPEEFPLKPGQFAQIKLHPAE